MCRRASSTLPTEPSISRNLAQTKPFSTGLNPLQQMKISVHTYKAPSCIPQQPSNQTVPSVFTPIVRTYNTVALSQASHFFLHFLSQVDSPQRLAAQKRVFGPFLKSLLRYLYQTFGYGVYSSAGSIPAFYTPTVHVSCQPRIYSKKFLSFILLQRQFCRRSIRP